MKYIIAGGRNQRISHLGIIFLGQLPDLTEVVSGGCPTGIDRDGENWARNHIKELTRMPADWLGEGKKAGPIRNRQMAEYADALAVFPGGFGTANMIGEMARLGKPIHYFSVWSAPR